MARARIASKIKQKLGMLVYGKQGSGKSTFALQIAKWKREDGKPFRVLYIDTESGSIDSYIDDLIDEGIDVSNIYTVYTQSLVEVNEYIKLVANNEDFYELDEEGNYTNDIVVDSEGNPFRADAIVIDSVSVLYISAQAGLTEFSKLRAEVRANKNEVTGLEKKVSVQGAGLEIKDYNTLKFDGQDLILSLLGCGKHFIVVSRETDEKQQKETNEKGKFTSVVTGEKIADGFKDLAYNVKTVLRLTDDEYGNIIGEIKGKDRSRVHQRNEVIENPSLSDWEVLISKGKDKKDYVLANNLQTAVKTEMNRYMESEDISKEEVKSEASEMTVEQLKAKIKDIVDSFSPTKKKALKPKLDKVGLPTKYSTLTSIEDLKTFLSIIEE